MLNSRKGFTLVELIVVMAVFIVVIIITADSFNTILTQMTKITKSEESNIEGVVGLEMFRHDLQQAGYGLPYSFQIPINYSEAAAAPASDYNDGTSDSSSRVPLAVVAGNDRTTGVLTGTDYLALKGTALGLNGVAQKWTYMPYSSGITGKLKPRVWQTGGLEATDRVIVVRRTFSANNIVNELIASGESNYSVEYSPAGFALGAAAFNPVLPQDLFYLYGIRNGALLRMPFNRTDYYVTNPASAADKPASCAPNTGILYKGVVNHDNGSLLSVPLLDCVADMQVVFGWDVDDGQGSEGQDGILDTYSTPTYGASITVSPSANLAWVKNAMGETGTPGDADKLRKALKVIKVNILAQVGRRDPNYQSSASYVLGDATAESITKTYTLTAAQRQYHWKVYRIVVRPKNLLSNQ